MTNIREFLKKKEPSPHWHFSTMTLLQSDKKPVFRFPVGSEKTTKFFDGKETTFHSRATSQFVMKMVENVHYL